METLPPLRENRGPLLLRVTWIAIGIASVFMAARIFARIKTPGRLKLDDYLMLLALLFGIIAGGLTTESVKWGFGRRISSLGPEQVSQALKYRYIIQFFSILALAFGRVSFAISLLILIGITKTRRWILYGLIIGQVVFTLYEIGLDLSQCSPVTKNWNPEIPGSCLSRLFIVYSGYVEIAWNIFTDFALALLPAVVISNLHIKLGLKLGLIFLLCLGIFNIAAAIVTIVELSKFGVRTDITYDVMTVDIWTVIQIYLVIIAASIPFTRPLFRDSKVFSLEFYRAFLNNHAYKARGSGAPGEILHLGSRRNKGYAIHEDNSSPPRVQQAPRDCVVTASLHNKGFDQTYV